MGTAEKVAAFLGPTQPQAGPSLQQLSNMSQVAAQQVSGAHLNAMGQVKNQGMNLMPLGQNSTQARTLNFLGSLLSAKPVNPALGAQPHNVRKGRSIRIAGKQLGKQLGVATP